MRLILLTVAFILIYLSAAKAAVVWDGGGVVQTYNNGFRFGNLYELQVGSGDFQKVDTSGNTLPVDFNEIDEVNLLLNRSFELNSVAESWTYTPSGVDTPATETTIKIEGKQSVLLTPSAETFTFDQSVSIDQFDQKFVEFSCEINSTEVLKVCFLQAGSETQCVNTLGNDSFVRYGARGQVSTGNTYGIRIKSDVSITDNVYVDACKFSSNYDQFAETQEENEFSAKIQNNGTASIISQGGLDQNLNNAIASVNRSAGGTVDVTFTSGFFSVIPKVDIYLPNTSGAYANRDIRIIGLTTSGFTARTFQITTAADQPEDLNFNIDIQRQDDDYKPALKNIVTPSSNPVTSWQSYTPTITGHGTPSNVSFFYREYGGFLEIRGSFDSGVSTASPSTFTMPSGFTGNDVTQANNIGIYGQATKQNTAGVSLGLSVQNGLSVVELRPKTGNYESQANGSSFVNAGETVYVYGRFPVAELSDDLTVLANNPVNLECVITDEKSSSTNGGTFTSGSYQTRDLNTLSGDCSAMGISLSSNQIIQSKVGKYSLTAYCPAYLVGSHKCKQRDITTGSDVKIGSNAVSGGSGNTSNVSVIESYYEVFSPTTYEIQHRGSITQATNGYGLAANFGDSEVYTVVKIRKVE